jgi:rhomboid protease GluP
MKEKIRLLLPPFVLVLAGLTAIYTFLHWLLFIRFQVIELKDTLLNIGAPIVLSGIAVLVWLRSRTKALDLQAKKANWLDFYSVVLWVLLCVPLIIAQFLMLNTTGKLEALDSINTISAHPQARFFSVKNVYVDKVYAGVYSSVDASGKYNEDLNMHIYIAMPILPAAADTAGNSCAAWLGMEYSETISNRLDSAEKEDLFTKFANRSQLNFDTMDPSRFVYLERAPHSDEREGYLKAIRSNTKFDPEKGVVLEAINKPFETRSGNSLWWLAGTMLGGCVIWLIMILIPKLDHEQHKRIEAGKPDTESSEAMSEMLDILKPKDDYFITPLLIYANTGVFIAMVIAGFGFISFDSPDLLKWGANYGPATRGGEWWRLLTNIFMHGGFLHLFANMYGLLLVGIFLEPLLGRATYLIAYLLTGILASCASLWWYDATVSVGASGAIFGMYGIFLAFLLTKVFPPDFSKAFLASTIVFIGFNLLMGLTGGIDNAAHIGGLLSGFVLGLLLYKWVKKKANSVDY